VHAARLPDADPPVLPDLAGTDALVVGRSRTSASRCRNCPGENATGRWRIRARDLATCAAAPTYWPSPSAGRNWCAAIDKPSAVVIDVG
jgi:hypothetical protein